MVVVERWECPKCRVVYESPLVLACPPTHQCNPNIKRCYEMRKA
jgi:hypothetical protein